MATPDELKIRIIAKDEASKVFKQTRGEADRLKSSLTALKVGIVGMTVAGGAFLKSVIDTGSQVQNLRIRMKFLTGSAKDGALAFKAMNQYASRVPFALEDIQSGVPSLLTVTKSTDELNTLLAITGDLAAASGLSYADTARQLQRAFAAGINSAEMFKDQGIDAMLGFEKGVSYSADKTRKIIIDAFVNSTTTVVGGAQAMANTFTGSASMMQDAWFQFKMQLAETGVIDEATQAIKQLTEVIKDPSFIEGAKTFSSAFLELFRFTVANWKILAAVGAVWLGGKAGGLKGAAATGALAGLVLLLDQFGLLKQKVEETTGAMDELNNQTEGLVFNITGGKDAGYLETFWEGAVAGVKKYKEAVSDIKQQATDMAMKGMKGLEDSLMDVIQGTKNAKEAFSDMARAIIADIIRITIRQMILKALGFAFPSFAGGGYTGNSPRTGGLDGKGGFAAILHPNETVIDHVKGRAVGGQVNAGQPYMVGEQGREMFVPSVNGQIVKNSDVERMGGSGGAVNVNFTINAVDTRGFSELLSSRRSQIVNMVNQAMNDRGRAGVTA